MIERGAAPQVPLVLIPGWGFTGEVLRDHVAFKDETVILSTGFTSPLLLAGLAAFLEEQQIDTVRVLGWSMGGNLGVDFARQSPTCVSSLTLVAVRQSWCQEDIDVTRQGLHDVSGIGMEKFYRKCFLGAKAEYKQFSTELLMSYVHDRDVDVLDTGLTYLATHRMPQSLPMPVHIIQGTKDVVCPVHEMVHFPTRTQITMLDGAGHFPFSRADFRL